MPADDSPSLVGVNGVSPPMVASHSASERTSPTDSKERKNKHELMREALEPFWLSGIECAKYFDFSSVISVPVVPDEETNPPLDEKAWESDEETRGFFHALSSDPRRKHPTRIQRLLPPPSDVRNSGPPIYRHRPAISFEEFVQKHSRQVTTARAAHAQTSNQLGPSKPRRSPSVCVAPVRARPNNNPQSSFGDSKELPTRHSKVLTTAKTSGKLPATSENISSHPVRAKRSIANDKASSQSFRALSHGAKTSGGSSSAGNARSSIVAGDKTASKSIKARSQSSISSSNSTGAGKARTPPVADQDNALVTATSSASFQTQTCEAYNKQVKTTARPVRAAGKTNPNGSSTEKLSQPSAICSKTLKSADTAPSNILQISRSKSTRTTRDTASAGTKESQPKRLQKVCGKQSSLSSEKNVVRPKSLQAPHRRGPGSLTDYTKRSAEQRERAKSLRGREGLVSVPDRCERQHETSKSLRMTNLEARVSALGRASPIGRPKSLGAPRLTGLQQPLRSTSTNRNTAGGTSMTIKNRRSTFLQRNSGHVLGAYRRTSTIEDGTSSKKGVFTNAPKPMRALKKTQALGPSEKTKLSFAAPRLGHSRVSQGTESGKLVLGTSMRRRETQTKIPLSPRRQIRSMGNTNSINAAKTAGGNSLIPSSPRRLVRSLGRDGLNSDSGSGKPSNSVNVEIREVMKSKNVLNGEKPIPSVENRDDSSDTKRDATQIKSLLVEDAPEKQKNAMCVDVEALILAERSTFEGNVNDDGGLENVPAERRLLANVPPLSAMDTAVPKEEPARVDLVFEISQSYLDTKSTQCFSENETRKPAFLKSGTVNNGNVERNLAQELKMLDEGSPSLKNGHLACLKVSGATERPIQPRSSSAQTAGNITPHGDLPSASPTECESRCRLEPRAKSVQGSVSCKGAMQQNEGNYVVQEVRPKGDLSLTSLLNARNNRVLQWRSKQQTEQQRALDKENLSMRYQNKSDRIDRKRVVVTGRSFQPWGNAKRSLVPTKTRRAPGVEPDSAKGATGMQKGGGKTVRGLRLRTNRTLAKGAATISPSKVVQDEGHTKTDCLKNVLSEHNQQGAMKKSFVRLNG